MRLPQHSSRDASTGQLCDENPAAMQGCLLPCPLRRFIVLRASSSGSYLPEWWEPQHGGQSETCASSPPRCFVRRFSIVVLASVDRVVSCLSCLFPHSSAAAERGDIRGLFGLVLPRPWSTVHDDTDVALPLVSGPVLAVCHVLVVLPRIYTQIQCVVGSATNRIKE